MKLSEMFAKMLGDKDVELTYDNPKPEPKPEQEPEPKPEPVQEPVDIALLKKEIEDLKKANLQLIMQGSLNEESPEQSDEDIIMDLCVRNRRRNGNESDTSTTEL